VSTLAAACPDQACGLAQPGQHQLHRQLAEARARASGTAETVETAEAPFDVRVLTALRRLLSELDQRSRLSVLVAQATCPDCDGATTVADGLAGTCDECGYPDVVGCAMPPGCDRSAARLARVSGRWLPVCDRHSPCIRCNELIDESRHLAHVQIDPASLSRPGRGLSSRMGSAARRRIYSHVDAVVCEAFVWLRELKRLGVSVDQLDGDGVLITAVEPGSAAGLVGIADGAILVKLGNRRVIGLPELVSAITATPAHQAIDVVTISPKGKKGAVELELLEPSRA